MTGRKSKSENTSSFQKALKKTADKKKGNKRRYLKKRRTTKHAKAVSFKNFFKKTRAR